MNSKKKDLFRAVFEERGEGEERELGNEGGDDSVEEDIDEVVRDRREGKEVVREAKR